MSNLKNVDSEIIENLSRCIPSNVFSKIDDKYRLEPRGKFFSTAKFVAKPSDTNEVLEIVKLANSVGFGVVPFSGGSGLVGGQIATNGQPLLLSLERLNKYRDFDPISGIITVESGMVLSEVKNLSQNFGRQFPLALASQGSCMIGGNLATNAGGVNVLKYGNTRDLCLGIEAVLADGRLFNDLKELKKDNFGFDIKNLLIGSEGTLGIITSASLKTFPVTNNTVAMVSISSPSEAVELFDILSSKLEFCLQAFELISSIGIKFLSSTGLRKSFPINSDKGWLALIEVGSAEIVVTDFFESLLNQATEKGIIDDVIISQNDRQYHQLWEIRELIPEANRLIGSISNHDISLPLARIADFIGSAVIEISKISSELQINCFGHIGDGNLHFNVFPPSGSSKEDYEEYKGKITVMVNDLVLEYKGSISAEHGIGRLKKDELYRYSDPTKLELMKSIKNTFDPNNILNPGSIFPIRKSS